MFSVLLESDYVSTHITLSEHNVFQMTKKKERRQGIQHLVIKVSVCSSNLCRNPLDLTVDTDFDCGHKSRRPSTSLNFMLTSCFLIRNEERLRR